MPRVILYCYTERVEAPPIGEHHYGGRPNEFQFLGAASAGVLVWAGRGARYVPPSYLSREDGEF